MNSLDITNSDPLAIVFYADLEAKFGIAFSKTHLGRLEAAGNFPPRIHLTPGRCAWLQSEIREWLAERIAQRDTLPVRAVPQPRIVRGAAGRNSREAVTD